VLRILWGVWD